MRTVFNRIPEFKLKEYIKDSTSIAQVFRKIGLCASSEQYKSFKKRVIELNIDLSHFKGQYDKLKFSIEVPLKKIFVINSQTSSSTVKKKILKFKLKPYICEICKNDGYWLNKPISLQLDHIDGNNTNNQLDNLRWLCPNCHTQTDTYAGKRLMKKYFCQDCGNEISHRKFHRCLSCASKIIIKNNPFFQEKINWPEKQELEQLVWKHNLVELSKILSSSPNGIKKHCLKIGVKLPTNGYWQRIKAGKNHQEALVKTVRIPKFKQLNNQIIQEIKDLKLQGLSNRKIGKLKNIAHTTVARALI